MNSQLEIQLVDWFFHILEFENHRFTLRLFNHFAFYYVGTSYVRRYKCTCICWMQTLVFIKHSLLSRCKVALKGNLIWKYIVSKTKLVAGLDEINETKVHQQRTRTSYRKSGSRPTETIKTVKSKNKLFFSNKKNIFYAFSKRIYSSPGFHCFYAVFFFRVMPYRCIHHILFDPLKRFPRLVALFRTQIRVKSGIYRVDRIKNGTYANVRCTGYEVDSSLVFAKPFCTVKWWCGDKNLPRNFVWSNFFIFASIFDVSSVPGWIF